MQIENDPDAANAQADLQFARRRLDATPRRDGMVAVEGLLDPVGGEALLTALDALMPPEPGDLPREAWRTPAQRRADALSELARRALDTGQLPDTGGERPHVSVVVALQTLQGRPGAPAAELAWIGPVAGEAARRICCDAGICRVVTGGRSEPLDVGRRTRLVTPAQRRALVVRDRGCRWCGAPRPGRRPITSVTGLTEARPTSRTSSCSAAPATIACTKDAGGSPSTPMPPPPSPPPTGAPALDGHHDMTIGEPGWRRKASSNPDPRVNEPRDDAGTLGISCCIAG